MENQAFEEEQQPRLEETANPRSFSFRSSSRLEETDTDNHVYEDILPGIEEISTSSDVEDLRSKTSVQRSFDIVDYASREDETEISGAFRRNHTLPFRRGVGLDSLATSSSVRLTNRRRNACTQEAEVGPGNTVLVDDAFGQLTTLQIECKPNRRRRKKDCKHCRNKAASSTNDENDTVLRKNRDNQQSSYAVESKAPLTILDPSHLSDIPAVSSVKRMDEVNGCNNLSSVFSISEKVAGSKLIEYERNNGHRNLVKPTEMKGNDVVSSEKKTRTGMRVNSIYSQDRWYAKETSNIFFTDVKEHSSFQRANSLPLGSQTPSSQNRINLRRSVRGEPPPHPARLRKHRHGWTMHLARPIETSGCTRSLVLLLILIVTLLGIGAMALYIVFEPEKLQMIQQYLKSSTNESSNGNTLLAGTFLHDASSRELNYTSTTPANTVAASILSNGDQSLPENTMVEFETEAASTQTVNSTRYCDDCLPEEVCVALVDEEVPICRVSLDPRDPTGCAGFCLVNKQKCHRLDVDAFRCVDIEHYCLDDEWTCSNTLCIPVDKRCDGHMNCYDHSDEYNCVCDPETHFQCGNETSCLPLEKRCDGKIDCWDAADEINCTLGRNLGWSCPSGNEFTCSNGQCILKARFCDGLPDCLDGSDEPHGCQGRCNKHEFTCQNNRCITKGMKCNGVDDCGDGTDERHCKDRIS
nr:uncharacterized protein LOC117602595 isoform X1 [Osmia lignaria]XP_034176708.1 uncharacterized protein LOC117602595 isoform X1 [Osmia lignaria]